ncbi:MAG: heavy metal translocating P-type ATPase [Congregibacter sp.]
MAVLQNIVQEETNSCCYHCGEEVPAGIDLVAEIDGELEPMCCPGCQAVVLMIVGNGLEDFYRERTAFTPKPKSFEPSRNERFSVYDDDALSSQFSQRTDRGLTEARLLIGGVSCAACTWLIETSLQRLEAVQQASLNLSQGRLDVSFDSKKLPMSQLFATVAGLGYAVHPWHSNTLREQTHREFKTDLRRLAVAGIGMMQVGMFSIALHAGDLQGISPEYQKLLRVVSLLVTSFVVFFSARGFFESAWRHLRQGVLVMDLPVAIAIGAAFGASVIATLGNSGAVYFDSVVMFTFLLLGARFVERRLRYQDTLAWQDAEEALPDAVRCWRNSSWTISPRSQITPGDRLLIRQGDTLPIDGQLVQGNSAVREDSFNGESLPRTVGVGDTVYAGTINQDASLEIIASGSYAETRLAALQRSIERASHDKPAIAHLADRIASRFILVVLLLSTATGIFWWFADPGRAFWIALSVLVVSCPCALSLATPSALANATSLLRSRGLLVNGDNALESLAQVDAVFFDKTGTLTTGDFTLETVHALTPAWTESQLLSVAAALQKHSNHPIASAFTTESQPPFDVTKVNFVPGAGMRASTAGGDVRMGSLAFCREIAPAFPKQPEAPLYWVGLCIEGEPLAWLGFSDRSRPENAEIVAYFKQRDLRVEMLSGDTSNRATQLASSLHLDAAHIGLSPEEKCSAVRERQESGAVVLMVGDGLNDAPVLKQADVSVAVPGATDLARAQADFVIANGNLSQLLLLHKMAIATQNTIRQNFAWALAYNALAIPLAAMGMVPPWAAALGMSLSSLVVVANAARLRSVRVAS